MSQPLRTNAEVLARVASVLSSVSALIAAALLASAGKTHYAIYAAVLALALPLVCRIALTTEPAITASVAVLLTVFGGNWHYAHIPVPLDRVAWLMVLAALWWRRVGGDPRWAALRVRRVHIVLLAA